MCAGSCAISATWVALSARLKAQESAACWQTLPVAGRARSQVVGIWPALHNAGSDPGRQDLPATPGVGCPYRIGRRIECAAAVKSRAQAVREANDEAGAMTLLMRDNEVQQHRTRLAGLEQRFQIGLAQCRDDLNNTPCDKKPHDNKRQQSVQDAVIQRLDPRTRNLLEPRAVATGLRSLDPVGLARAAIAAPGILLGGLLSLLLAFGLEFRDQLRIWRGRRHSPPFALHWNLRRPPVCRVPC